MADQPASSLPTNEYDRLMGQMQGLPGVLQTRPSIVNIVQFTGQTSTWIVTTMRQRTAVTVSRDDDDNKWVKVNTFVFLIHTDANGSQRYVLPPDVVDTIIAQRDALVEKARRSGAKQAAKTRKARGIVPGFLKNKKGGK